MLGLSQAEESQVWIRSHMRSHRLDDAFNQKLLSRHETIT